MKWIYFYQKFNSRIKYTTSEIDFAVTMQYDKFVVFVQKTYHIKDFLGMQKAMDSFKPIFAFDDGTWKVEEPKLNLSTNIFEIANYQNTKTISQKLSTKPELTLWKKILK